MKIKKKWLLCLLVASLALATACGGGSVKKDLESYITEAFPAIKEQDDEIVRIYEEAIEEDYRANTLFADAIFDQLIPLTTELAKHIASVTPKTADVKGVHDLITRAVHAQLDAYDLMVEAVTNLNSDMIRQANDLLGEAMSHKSEYIGELKMLSREHDVTLPGTTELQQFSKWIDPDAEEPPEYPATGDQKPLVFPLVDPYVGYVEATLGEFSEFLDRLFAEYDITYPDPGMMKFYGAGHDGHGYALNIRYEAMDDEAETGGESTITLFEIESMVVSDVPESGGFLLDPEETRQYLYEHFAE